MRKSHLLTISALLEMATGSGLMLFPDAIAVLLFSQGLAGAGLAVGRVTGFALLALGWTFWGARHSNGTCSIATAMFGYNSLVAIYLATVGIDSRLTGMLLWPAVVVHAAIALLCANLLFKRQLNSE